LINRLSETLCLPAGSGGDLGQVIKMAQAKVGDTVKVHYTGKFDNGAIFDTSEGGEPLLLKIGDGKVIKGFEEAVVGMSLGESKVLTIPPEKGYGAYRQDLEYELDREKLPSDLNPEIGQVLEICEEDGTAIPVEVMDVFDDKVVINANHPLAGVELTFEIKLLEII